MSTFLTKNLNDLFIYVSDNNKAEKSHVMINSRLIKKEMSMKKKKQAVFVATNFKRVACESHVWI